MEHSPIEEDKQTSIESVRHDGPKTAHGVTRTKDVVLVPQPSDDPEDPLNWPLRKKLLVFGCVCITAFAGQMSPNSNQLTFIDQVPTYNVTVPDMLNTVAAALAGWTAGPFVVIPFCALIGRSAVILWSMLVVFACQIWAAKSTGPNDFYSFLASRVVCGMFGPIPAILGSGYIVDMFFLHQRGKAFAIFEVLIIFAVVGTGTLSGFVANTQPWPYVFWWNLGVIGAAIVCTVAFLQDTGFVRDPSKPKRKPLPQGLVSNRVATFLPGTRTQPPGKLKEFIRRAYLPLQITFSPIALLVGTYIFIALGLPILQASTLATYLAPPPQHGGYGFSNLQIAYFTFSAWIGMLAAQAYGYFFNDKTPLWVARTRGGIWHPEYRLANTLLPCVLLPIALGIYGAGVQYHLHYMVLALGAFLIWFAALLALPVCYNYVVEIFLKYPVEASVSLNAYRVSFGLMSVFIVTEWQEAVGSGWMWGMGAFLIVFVDLIMIGIIFKGHIARNLTVRLNPSITQTEDGTKISIADDFKP